MALSHIDAVVVEVVHHEAPLVTTQVGIVVGTILAVLDLVEVDVAEADAGALMSITPGLVVDANDGTVNDALLLQLEHVVVTGARGAQAEDATNRSTVDNDLFVVSEHEWVVSDAQAARVERASATSIESILLEAHGLIEHLALVYLLEADFLRQGSGLVAIFELLSVRRRCLHIIGAIYQRPVRERVEHNMPLTEL